MHVAFASVLFAAASSAAVGHYYIEQRAAENSAAQAISSNVAPTPQPRRADAPLKRAQPAQAAEAELAAPVPVQDLPAARTQPARPRTDAGLNRKSDADAELLVEAMRARGAGDPARVSQLVDEYRAKHPQGVLQEEALILSIEAAVAQKSPNASSLAQQYLKRFPRGRFATQARRALASESKPWCWQ